MVPPLRYGLIAPLILIFLGILTSRAQSTSSSTIDPSRASKLRQLVAQAHQAADRLTDYRVRLRRREVIGDKQGMEETLMLTVRNHPFCVHVKCLPGSENEGREMLYVAGKPDAPMHVLTGKGDVISGLHMEVGVHCDRVMANSRHGIDEAGFSHSIERLNSALERYLAGQAGTGEFEPIGLQPRSESRVPMDVVVQHISPQQEKLLPHGGKRYWHFNTDPDAAERHLPTLVITFDDRGQQVEYYCFDRLLPRVVLESSDFDPERRWSRK
jgi:hypothetical protein